MKNSSNVDDIAGSNPPASPSLGTEPADLESLRAQLKRESRARFEELSDQEMLERE